MADILTKSPPQVLASGTAQVKIAPTAQNFPLSVVPVKAIKEIF